MKMKYIATIATAATLSLTSALSFAETKEQGSGPNPFVDCGIGAALFKDTSWAAVSSNVIWDVGTTAVTSATASPETCNAKKVETAQFILDSYDSLIEESAKGKGEHLTAMMNIIGCDSSAQSHVISNVRAGIAKNVSAETYSSQSKIEKASELYNVVNASAQSCSA